MSVTECFEMCDEVEATICCFYCSEREKCGERACNGEDCEIHKKQNEKAASAGNTDDLKE